MTKRPSKHDHLRLSDQTPEGRRHVDELTHRRGRFHRTVRNADGTMTQYVSPTPVHSYDKHEGIWTPRAYHFTTTAKGRIRADTGEFIVKMPETAVGWVVFKHDDGSRTSMRAIGVNPVEPTMSDDAETVTYENAWPGVDLAYECQPEGVKESIIIHTPEAFQSLQFAFIGDGEPLEPVLHPIDYVDAQTGEPIDTPDGMPLDSLTALRTNMFEYPRPWIEDATGRRFGVRWDFDDASQVMTITWVPDDEMAYPLLIDPTVTVGPTTVTNGATTTITTPAGATSITSVFVRFVPNSSSSTTGTSNSATDPTGTSASTSMPTVSGGHSGRCSGSVSRSPAGAFSLGGGGPYGSLSASTSNGTSLSDSNSGGYSPGSGCGAYVSSADPYSSLSASITATSYYDTTTYSLNPNIKLGTLWLNPTSSAGASSPSTTKATTTIGTFSSTTAWYSLAGFGFALGSNVFTHSSGRSIGHRYELQYTYVTNTAPLEPQLSSSLAGFPAASGTTIAITHQDSEVGDLAASYAFKRSFGAGPTVQWWNNTTKAFDQVAEFWNTVSAAVITLPASDNATKWTNGTTYQLFARTQDAGALQGPYNSVPLVVKASQAPTAAITTPGATYGFDSLPTTWTFTDPDGDAQSAFQVKLIDAFSNLLADSGKRVETATRSYTIPYTLVNGATYTVTVQVWDANDVPSTVVSQTFTIAFTPVAKPTLATGGTAGYVELSWFNPVPTGGEPTCSSNQLYKRQQGATGWTLLGTLLELNAIYQDWEVAHGVTYEYKVQAIGSNGTSSESDPQVISINLVGLWLHDISGTIAPFSVRRYTTRSVTYEPELAFHQFAGRPLPVAEFGTQARQIVRVRAVMVTSEGTLNLLKQVVEARATVLLRDNTGRRIFGVIPTLPLQDETWGGQVVSFEVHAVDVNR